MKLKSNISCVYLYIVKYLTVLDNYSDNIFLNTALNAQITYNVFVLHANGKKDQDCSESTPYPGEILFKGTNHLLIKRNQINGYSNLW